MYSCKMLIDNMLVPALPHLLDEGKSYEETCSPSYVMTGKKRPAKARSAIPENWTDFCIIHLFIHLFTHFFSVPFG